MLTRREIEVLRLMAAGRTNQQIADELVISTGTVKSHVKRVRRKLHATNRAEAASTYVRLVNLPREEDPGGIVISDALRRWPPSPAPRRAPRPARPRRRSR